MTVSERLNTIAVKLQSKSDRLKAAEFSGPLDELERAAKDIGKSWSGSWFGYHSRVYYTGFKNPPAGARFSQEWGLMNSWPIEATVGEWREYTADQVLTAIRKHAGSSDIRPQEDEARETREMFDEAKSEVLSILSTAARAQPNDTFLKDLTEKVAQLKTYSASDLIAAWRPRGSAMSRDMVAIEKGRQTPPHVSILAAVEASRQPFTACAELAKQARRAASHFTSQTVQHSRIADGGRAVGRASREMGKAIFVVHGHDEAMKAHAARTIEKLGLEPVILHEKPNRGRTIIEKFVEFSEAGFAVVLLSPDDVGRERTRPENALRARARQNVILELGFFLGRLGRERVVALYREEQEFEMPSDYSGVLFVPFDRDGKWQLDLVRELKAAGYQVDANRLVG